MAESSADGGSVADDESVRPRPVRVLISYAHGEEEHEDAVRVLYRFLRSQGVDARIDLVAAQRRQDWTQWMEDEVSQADHVLVIASPAYKHRAGPNPPPASGLGVRYEATLMRDIFYRHQGDLQRFLPVVLPNETRDGLPTFLSPAITTVYFVKSFSVEGAEDLLRVLLGRPAEVEPPLGIPSELPSHLDTKGPFDSNGVERRWAAANFIGRADELTRVLHSIENVASEGLLPIVSIDGMAGVGKTAFARALISRLPEQYGNRSIVLDLLGNTAGQEPPAPHSSLIRLLSSEGIVLAGSEDGDELKGKWREVTAGRRMVLFLDNAVDDEQIIPLLPKSSGYNIVIVTSRQHLLKLRAHRSVHVTLDVLAAEDAVALYAAIAELPIAGSEQVVSKLTEWCFRLPLAITLLAARVDANVNIGGQWEEIESAHATVSDRDDPIGQHVAAAIGLTVERLPADRRNILRLAGSAPVFVIDIYGAAALTGLPIKVARLHFEALVDLRLMIKVGPNRFGMHDLIRHYIRDHAGGDGNERLDEAIDRLLSFYRYTAKRIDPIFSRQPCPSSLDFKPPPLVVDFPDLAQSARWMRSERDSLLRAAEYAVHANLTEWAIGFAECLSAFLRNDGLWGNLQKINDRAMIFAERSGNLLARANALNELGFLCRLRGDNNAAVQHLDDALALYRSLDCKIGQAHALDNLAVAIDRLGDSEKARWCLNTSLELYRSIGDLLGEANVLQALGVAHRYNDELLDATSCHESALALYERTGSALGQAHALLYLAMAQRRSGRLRPAEANLARAQTLYEQLGNRLGQSNVVRELGIVLRLAGDHEKTAVLLGESLNTSREMGNLSGEADAGSEIGALCAQMGDYDGARRYQADALGLYENLGNRRGEVIALNRLGDASIGLGDLASAEAFYRRALDTARKIASLDDERTALEGLGRVAAARPDDSD